MGNFGHDFVERKSYAIAELIDLAALGQASWDDVNNEVVEAFPGSFSAIWNLDPLTGRPKTMSVAGLEDTFHHSLLEHYAGINPWNAYWEAMPSGHIAISERESPAALIAHTETSASACRRRIKARRQRRRLDHSTGSLSSPVRR